MPFNLKVGCCSLRFNLYNIKSIKDKRRIVRTIKDRVKNKFNISIAEIGNQDKKDSLYIGIGAVSSDARYLNGLMNQVINFIDTMYLVDMADHHIEIIHLDHGS